MPRASKKNGVTSGGIVIGWIFGAGGIKDIGVMTEADGKATGWKAFHEGGRWQEQVPAKKTVKKATKKAAKKAPKKAPRKKAPAKSADQPAQD